MHHSVPFEDAPGFGGFQFQHVDALLLENQQSPVLAAPIISVEHENELIQIALKTLSTGGADFGDLRLGNDFYRTLYCLDTNVTEHGQSENSGIGIRCLYKGFWGFAATPDLTPEGVKRCARQALSLAKGLTACTPSEFSLDMKNWAPEPPHRGIHHTPVAICPFTAPLEDIVRPFVLGATAALEVEGIKQISSNVIAFGRRRIFASTEGAHILTTHCMVDSAQTYTAVANDTSAYRTIVGANMAGGLEHLIETNYPGRAAEAARDAVAKCHADKPAAGEYDLILDGHNLALTMHESVGHPTELDRVLGYELGFAGGSFATLDKLNSFEYGSPIVNFTANNRIRFGAASLGYDDEGVACQSFPIIKEGQLVGYGTNRETAHQIGLDRSNGNCRSTSWADPPIVRIPNLYLEPGPAPLSLDDLIGDTKDGIYMMGRDSFSIDQMRMNFQFGSNMAYRIRDGRLAEPLRDVIYQSISTEFWRSCDAICDADHWQMHGVFNCGKGQPMQLAKMTHGAAPARFRNIRVGY